MDKPRGITLPEDEWRLVRAALSTTCVIAESGVRDGVDDAAWTVETTTRLIAAIDKGIGVDTEASTFGVPLVTHDDRVGPDWDGFVQQLQDEISWSSTIHPDDLHPNKGTGQAQADQDVLVGLIRRVRGVQDMLGYGDQRDGEKARAEALAKANAAAVPPADADDDRTLGFIGREGHVRNKQTPAVRRLAAAGLIEFTPDTRMPDLPRRCYQISDAGKARFEELVRADALWVQCTNCGYGHAWTRVEDAVDGPVDGTSCPHCAGGILRVGPVEDE